MRLPLGYVKMGIGLLRRLYWHVTGVLLFRVQLLRLRFARTPRDGGPDRPRVIASAGWYFPIYSHTFVYQELTQLIHAGYRLRFFYGSRVRETPLPVQFQPLLQARHRMVFHPTVCRRSVRYFTRRAPARVHQLLADLQAESGLSRETLLKHEHIGQAFAFARLAEAYGADYLHSYFFYQDTLYALVASVLLDVPRGVSCYADHMLTDYPLKVVRLHLRQCSVVVATSRRIEEELRALEPSLPADRVLVKVNAISTRHFPARVRSAPASGNPFVLASVCRIEPKKGLVDLAAAVRILRDQGHHVAWFIAGGVDDTAASQGCRDELVTRIADWGLQQEVTLLGKQSEDEINALFARAHLFVAPFVETSTGDKDGIPTAVLEAMAAGLPIVATDAGSITEVIEPDVTGIITPQRNPAALAAAIAALMGDGDRRDRLGRAAAASVRQRFDVAVCERPLHDRIARVVGRTAPITPVHEQVSL